MVSNITTLVHLLVGLHVYVVIVDRNLHAHFDNEGWLLLPDKEIIDAFKETVVEVAGSFYAVQEKFPNFDEVCCLPILTRLYFLTGKS